MVWILCQVTLMVTSVRIRYKQDRFIVIKNAYRIVSINPDLIKFKGLKWEFEDRV